MREFARIAALRLWLAEREISLGLLIAVAVTGVILSGLVVFVLPTGPSERLHGRILRFGLSETDLGSYPIAVVQLPNQIVQVGLPRSNRCTVGGTIDIFMQPRLLGPSYTAALSPCRAAAAH